MLPSTTQLGSIPMWHCRVQSSTSFSSHKCHLWTTVKSQSTRFELSVFADVVTAGVAFAGGTVAALDEARVAPHPTPMAHEKSRPSPRERDGRGWPERVE